MFVDILLELKLGLAEIRFAQYATFDPASTNINVFLLATG